MARSARGWHEAVPSLFAERHGFDTRNSFTRLFHYVPSSQERVRIHDSIHKETLRHEITNTRISGGNGIGQNRFADYDLAGRVFIATGGAQGLGLSMAEALAKAGGKGELSQIQHVGVMTANNAAVYCLDRAPTPDEAWDEARSRLIREWGGSLHYKQQDVTDTVLLDETVTAIAEENQRLDGVIAAAGVQQLTPATEYRENDVARMLAINYTGVLMTASSAARQMLRYKCKGSICLIASMSGLVANKGLVSPVYNSSKAAVIQLARSLAMEWSPTQKDGTGGIRVNCISPGHILTPMVRKNFEEVPGLKGKWERENMLGRLADPDEFKGAALFLMSDASSFMTANNLIIDGGHTSW
ncbi:putative short chain dehydrogenase [Diaporthe ampelina]|uniref:Putative short chain dehydrogenase n=1 Tax=Diaporthe ampelina TaxID=1214573 RepID=A0A0G2H3U3_9PEZI|nr:putative short chain dehydrogenase [Diaporthe ampelina]